MKSYLDIWICLARNSLKTQLSTSLGSAGYLVGKIFRFVFFFTFLIAIFRHLPSLNGYTAFEVVLFFLTFNIVDVGAQFLFRGLYGVKYLIDEGDFDKILTQPAHPLFRISFMGVDFLDLLTLVPVLGVMVFTLGQLNTKVGVGEVLVFSILIINAFVLAYAFHVSVAALSVLTQEFESAIWVYRDVMTLGRFPVSIYNEFLRGLFVTLAPIGIMISFPTQALLGLLSWKGVFYSIFLGAIFHVFSQGLWRFALQRYTSNSI